MKNLYEKIAQDIVCGEDGFFVYWPNTQGAFTSQVLRQIADILELLNKPYAAQIDEYFKNNPG